MRLRVRHKAHERADSELPKADSDPALNEVPVIVFLVDMIAELSP